MYVMHRYKPNMEFIYYFLCCSRLDAAVDAGDTNDDDFDDDDEADATCEPGNV